MFHSKGYSLSNLKQNGFYLTKVNEIYSKGYIAYDYQGKERQKETGRLITSLNLYKEQCL